MDLQKLLVVMPAYNAEDTIQEAIESIIKQTFENWMLIIVDDNSTDRTLSIAKKYLYDKRILVFSNSENRGAYYCRNAGLHIARNMNWDVFTTHDADDVSYSFRFDTMMSSFRNGKVNGANDMFKRVDRKTNKSLGSSITVAHAFFSRRAFISIGYFEEVRVGADWEYWERLILNNKCEKKYKTISVKKVLGDSYVGDNNLTVSVPLKSPVRQNYMADTPAMHKEMEQRKKFYMPFRFMQSVTEEIKEPKIDISNILDKTITTRSQGKKRRNKVTVVLLTWQRIASLKKTLTMLSNQTYKDFDVHITNANERHEDSVNKIAKSFADYLDISVSHDGNDLYAFRRFTVGKELYKQGSKAILFIDDDITFPEDYVERCVKSYKPNTYQSGFTWQFHNNGTNYYKYRTKITDSTSKIHYCGTGISIIDASIFNDKRLFDAPNEALKIEDLWLSYFAQHVLEWDLVYIPMPDVTIGGTDEAALFKQIIKEKQDNPNSIDKADLLRLLVKQYNWNLQV